MRPLLKLSGAALTASIRFQISQDLAKHSQPAFSLIVPPLSSLSLDFSRLKSVLSAFFFHFSSVSLKLMLLDVKQIVVLRSSLTRNI